MNYSKVNLVTLLVMLCLVQVFSLHAITLPALVSDGMVLQRNTHLKIWGWADADEEIRIRFKGKKYVTTTDSSGKWLVTLPPMKAGGPYTMEISGTKDQVTVSDILIGDVWLCAGQSNMVHYLDLHKERYEAEIARANYPQIRQFLIPVTSSLQEPKEDIAQASWKAATPEQVLRFSVVAYFFAKALHEKYEIPIGLINASVGGSPIEAWTSENGLREFPEMRSTIQKNKDTAYVHRVDQMVSNLNRELAKQRPADKGLELKWYEPAYQAQNWNTINIPGYWEDQGVKELNGVVWYRKEVDVPASMTGVNARVALGRIVDADELYINGKLVGSTTYQYPQRRYDVPADLLRPGKNVFVVRVTNKYHKGGFIPDKPYYLAAGPDTLDLKGYWQYKVGAVYTDSYFQNGSISANHQPTGYFNGMLAPLTNYPIKGALWYQGESNTGNPEQYRQLLPALISDWRKQWNQEKLPFLYVQLPNYMEVDYSPSESQWAELREAQCQALNVPHTAMAVAIDLGEWNDIHPGNKKPIGDRLALAAQKVAYGEKNVVFSGPDYSSASVDDGKVTLAFKQTGSGLTARDGEELRWFAIAGADKQFVWADAEINGDQVVLRNDQVPNPVYVRYAWADNPDHVNFYNKEGLPASPFQAQVAEVSRWHGKKAAVVLTYDDALEVHLDHAIPVLDSLGLVGSFYLSAASEGVQKRIEDWRNAAKNGHELGNHTLFHPCDASKAGRSWVKPDNDLSKYSTARITSEVRMTDVFLKALDGKNERTFAYTCGDTETGEGSFVGAIQDQFVALRGVRSGLNKPAAMDLTNLNCYVVNEDNAGQLIEWAEKAKAENALLVVLFHGVGGGHPINVEKQKHHDFLRYLKTHEDDYWVTTLLEASRHVREQAMHE